MQLPVLNAQYGSHHTKPFLYGDFKNWMAMGIEGEQFFFYDRDHSNHCTELTLRSDIDPKMCVSSILVVVQ